LSTLFLWIQTPACRPILLRSNSIFFCRLFVALVMMRTVYVQRANSSIFPLAGRRIRPAPPIRPAAEATPASSRGQKWNETAARGAPGPNRHEKRHHPHPPLQATSCCWPIATTAKNLIGPPRPLSVQLSMDPRQSTKLTRLKKWRSPVGWHPGMSRFTPHISNRRHTPSTHQESETPR